MENKQELQNKYNNLVDEGLKLNSQKIIQMMTQIENLNNRVKKLEEV